MSTILKFDFIPIFFYYFGSQWHKVTFFQDVIKKNARQKNYVINQYVSNLILIYFVNDKN